MAGDGSAKAHRYRPCVLEKCFLQGGGRMGSVIVGLVLAGIVGLAVRSMVKDKKNGKSIQCGGECKNCGGHCH